MKTPLLLEHVFLCFPSKALINQQGKVKDIGVDLLEGARILKGKSHLQTKERHGHRIPTGLPTGIRNDSYIICLVLMGIVTLSWIIIFFKYPLGVVIHFGLLCS